MQIRRFEFEKLWDFSEGLPADPSLLIPGALQESAMEQALADTIIPTKPVDDDEISAEIPESFISEAEFEIAKQHAFDEGFAKGKMEGETAAMQKAEEERIATEMQLKILVEQFKEMQRRYAFVNDAIAEELKTLTLAVGRHVADTALDALPIQCIEQTIEQCAPLFMEEPAVILTVHPTVSERFKDALTVIMGEIGYQGKFKVVGDASLHVSDIRIEWEGGDAARNTEELWSDIENIVKAMPLTDTLNQIEIPEAEAELAHHTTEPAAPVADTIPVDNPGDSIAPEPEPVQLENTEAQATPDVEEDPEEEVLRMAAMQEIEPNSPDDQGEV